jgi:hypothetical protein
MSRTSALNGKDEDTRTAELVVQEEQRIERLDSEKQTDRELRIAECNRMIGRVQGLNMIARFGDVASLKWLRDVKESKVYKDLPGVGTWDTFCNSVGLSRRKVDEDIQNIETFGETFLDSVAGLSLGYRDLRKLRRQITDGGLVVDAEAVEIGGENIPLDPDHRDDLRDAIEALLEDKNAEISAQKKLVEQKETTIDKRDAEITDLEEKKKGLQARLDLATHKRLHATEEEYLKRIDADRLVFDAFLSQFDPAGDESPLPEDYTPRMEAAYLGLLDYFKRQITVWHSHAIDLHGHHSVDDIGWNPPEAAAPVTQVLGGEPEAQAGEKPVLLADRLAQARAKKTPDTIN